MDKKALFSRIIIVGFVLMWFFLASPLLVNASANNSAVSHPNVRIRASTSSNWSGYAVESTISSPTNGFIKNVTGSWVVPTLYPDPSGQNTYVAIWVGIDGYSNNTVEQIGTEQEIVNGVQQNYAWIELYPKAMKILFAVDSGDSITASVTYMGNNMFTLSLTDSSIGRSFSHTYKANAQRRSAEWIVEAPWSGGVLPLANFGTVNFDDAQFTDSTGTTYAIDSRGPGTYDSITMIDPSGGTATPSGLTTSAGGSSFTVTYSGAATPSPDFSISASPDSLTIPRSGSGISTVTVTSLNGFNSTVTLSLSGKPAGVTASFSPVSLTPTSGGSATSTLTISAAPSARTRKYTLTIVGTSGSLIHTYEISVKIVR
jgi:hypothetical protein